MNPLDCLKTTIDGFPGYAQDVDRRRSDELVRSYLGEAFAELQQRLGTLDDPSLSERIGELLIRLAFTNQAAYKIYEEDARNRTDFDAMAAADASTVEIAQQAGSIGTAQLPAYIAKAVEAIDRRDAVMRGAVAAPSSS